MSEITLPPKLTEIGENAFFECTSLADVTLPPNLTKIEDRAFFQCTSLTKIALPPNLTEIGQSAFFGCTSLSITLPAGPVDIGDAAFDGCPGTPQPGLAPALMRLGPIGWHRVETDRYDEVPVGTRIPAGKVFRAHPLDLDRF